MNKKSQREVTERLKALKDGTLDISAKEQLQWVMENLPDDKLAFNSMKCTIDGKEHIAYPLIVPRQKHQYWEKFDSKELEEVAKSLGGFITIGDVDFPIVEFCYPIESKAVGNESKKSLLSTALSTF